MQILLWVMNINKKLIESAFACSLLHQWPTCETNEIERTDCFTGKNNNGDRSTWRYTFPGPWITLPRDYCILGQTFNKREYFFLHYTNNSTFGREPWSSGNGRRLMYQRLWVQILSLYTGWTYFTNICCKNCNDVCLKRPKINDKRGRGWPIF